MYVTNCISTTKIQKISEITNFFRHYFLSRTEVQFRFKRLCLPMFPKLRPDVASGTSRRSNRCVTTQRQIRRDVISDTSCPESSEPHLKRGNRRNIGYKNSIFCTLIKQYRNQTTKYHLFRCFCCIFAIEKNQDLNLIHKNIF